MQYDCLFLKGYAGYFGGNGCCREPSVRKQLADGNVC